MRRDRGRRRADGKARRTRDCGGQRRLGIDEFLLRGGQIAVRGLDGVGRGDDLVARLDEVRTEGLHVADGRAAIGEHPPVAIERLDVALGGTAEALASGLERVSAAPTPASASPTRACATATGSSGAEVACDVSPVWPSLLPHATARRATLITAATRAVGRRRERGTGLAGIFEPFCGPDRRPYQHASRRTRKVGTRPSVPVGRRRPTIEPTVPAGRRAGFTTSSTGPGHLAPGGPACPS